MSQKKGRRKPHPLHVGSSVNAVALKVYLEQFLKDSGNNYTEDEIQNLTSDEVAQTMRKHLRATVNNFDKREVYIIAMVHDRDLLATEGSPFLPSAEKPHAHIIIKHPDRTKRAHVSTLLNKLGINFRNPKDIMLFNKGGCETIGSFNTYTLYLTHDTEKAIRDGKAQYELSEYISNLSIHEIKQIRDGNSRMLDISPGKVTMATMEMIEKEAIELGYNSDDGNASNYKEWYFSLPFSVRSNPKMKYVEESYKHAVRVKSELNMKQEREDFIKKLEASGDLRWNDLINVLRNGLGVICNDKEY